MRNRVNLYHTKTVTQMITIKTFNGQNETEFDFFVQSKGNNAGRPMRETTANCFGITTEKEILLPEYFYYVVLAAYEAGAFKPFLKGSVVPFITKDDFLTAVFSYLAR